MQADPLQERLRSLTLAMNDPDWKARASAYEMAVNLPAGDKIAIVARVCDILPKILSEITPLALEKALSLVLSVVNTCYTNSNTRLNWTQVIRALFDKVLSLGRPSLQKISEEIFFKAAERLGWKDSWGILRECLIQKNPKLQLSTLQVLRGSSNSGFLQECMLHLNLLSEKCQDPNPGIRGAAMDFLKHLVVSKGTTVLRSLAGLKPIQLNELASYADAGKHESRSVEGPDIINNGSKGSGEVESWETQEQVQILAKFPEAWAQKVEQEPNWVDKKKKLETLDAALGFGNRLEPAPYMHIVKLLKKILSETNVPLHMVCISIARKLASGLRNRFSQGFKMLNRCMLLRLRDKKPVVTEAVIQVLKAGTNCVTPEEVLEDYREMMKERNPFTKSVALKMLSFYASHPNAKTLSSSAAKNMLSLYKEGFIDPSLEVKAAAGEFLGCLGKLDTLDPSIIKEISELEAKRRDQSRTFLQPRPPALGSGNRSLTPTNSKESSRFLAGGALSPVQTPAQPLDTDRRVQSAEKPRPSFGMSNTRPLLGQKPHSNQGTPTASKGLLTTPVRPQGPERIPGESRNLSSNSGQNRSPIFKKPGHVSSPSGANLPFQRQQIQHSQTKKPLTQSEQNLSQLLISQRTLRPLVPILPRPPRPQQVVDLEAESDPADDMRDGVAVIEDTFPREAMKQEHIEGDAVAKASKGNSEEISTSSMVSVSQLGRVIQPANEANKSASRVLDNQQTHTGRFDENTSSEERNRGKSSTQRPESRAMPSLEPLFNIMTDIKLELDVKTAVDILVKQYGLSVEIFERLTSGTPQARLQQIANLRRLLSERKAVHLLHVVMILLRAATNQFRIEDPSVLHAVIDICRLVANEGESKSSHIVFEMLLVGFESIINKRLEELLPGQIIPNFEILHVLCSRLGIRRAAVMVLVNLKDKPSSTTSETGLIIISHIVHYALTNKADVRSIPIPEIRKFIEGGLSNVSSRMRKSSMGLLGWLSESQLEDGLLLQMHNQTELLHKVDYPQVLKTIRSQLGTTHSKDSHLELSSETGGSSLNLHMMSSGSEMMEEPKPVESEPPIPGEDPSLVRKLSAIEISMKAEGIEPLPTGPQRVLRKPLLATNQVRVETKHIEMPASVVNDGPKQLAASTEEADGRPAPITLEGTDRLRLELRDQELCLLKTALKTEYGEVFMNQMFSIETIKVADALVKIESRLKQKEPAENHTWLHSLLWILYRVSDSCNSELLEQFAATSLRLIHSADRQGKHLRPDEAQLLIAIVIRVISNQESPSGVQLFSGTFPYLLLQEHIDIFNSTCVAALSKPGLRSKDRILQLVYLFNKNSKNVMTLPTFFKFVGVLEYLSKSTIKEGCQAIKLCLSLLSVQDEVSVMDLVKNQGFSLRMMELWNSMILPKHEDVVAELIVEKPRTDLIESGVQTEPNLPPAKSEASVDAVCLTHMQEEALPATLIVPPEPQDTLSQLFSRPLLQLRHEIEEIMAAADLVEEGEAQDPGLGPALSWPITAMVLKKIVEVSKIKSVESETFLYSSSSLIIKFLSSVLRHSADLGAISTDLNERTKLGVELLQKVCGILTITSAASEEDLCALFLRLAEALAGYSSTRVGPEFNKPEPTEAFLLIRKLLNSALLRLVESDPCAVLKSLLYSCSQVRVGTPAHNILIKSLLQFGHNMATSLQRVTPDKLLDILDTYAAEVPKPIPTTTKQTLKSLVHSIWVGTSNASEEGIVWQKEGLIAEWIAHLSSTNEHQEVGETEGQTGAEMAGDTDPSWQANDTATYYMHIERLPVLSIQTKGAFGVKPAASSLTEPTDNNVFRNTRSRTKDLQSNTKPLLEEQSRESDCPVKMHTLGTQTVDSPLPNLLESLENTFEKPQLGRAVSKLPSSGKRMVHAPIDDDVSNISVTPLLAGMTPTQLKAMPASRSRNPISTLDIIEQLSNGVAAVSKYTGEPNYILNLADGRQVPSSKIIAPVQAVNSRNSSNKKEPPSKNPFESPQATRVPIMAYNSKPAGLNPVLQGMIRSYSQATVTHYRDHAAVIAGYLKRDFPTNTDDNDGIAPYLSELSPGQKSFLFSHLESSGLKKWIPTHVAQSRYPSSGKKSECSKHRSPSRGAAAGTSMSKIFQQLAAINQKLELVKPKPATNTMEDSRPRLLGSMGILGLGGSLQFPGSPQDNTTSNQISGSHMMVEDRTESINKLESQIHAVLKRIRPPGPK